MSKRTTVLIAVVSIAFALGLVGALVAGDALDRFHWVLVALMAFSLGLAAWALVYYRRRE